MSTRDEIWLVDCSLFSAAYDFHLGSALAEGKRPIRLLARPIRPLEVPPPTDLIYDAYFYRATEPLMRMKNKWAQKVARMFKGLEHLSGLVRLTARVWRDRPLLVHLFWTTLPNADRIAIRMIQKVCPVLVTVHNSIPLHGHRPLFNTHDDYVRVYQQADLLIAHAENTKKVMLEWGLDPARIDMITHPPLHLQVGGAEEVQRKPGRFRVLLWGAVKRYKGVEDLVEAVIRARKIVPEIELHIVGKPFYDISETIQKVKDQGQEDHITFDLEFKTEEALDAEIRACDLMALPYHEIDASGAFSTSLGYQKAFIMSDVGYFSLLKVPDAVREHAFIQMRDIDALTRNLVTLATRADIYQANVDAFEEVNRSYSSWSEVGKSLNAIYDRVLAERGQGALQAPSPAQAVSG
ncbi:glycosyltransferase [Phenylobacterium montanum]|uniref:Glycosyltransferase n=1 Tax=Phenylobacterium montanum TaxID=2823693 RepID=A0A975IW15_9CAUL|nr:glycosyltransferase [Caulobacter sp. S6]QUD87916.1 glycosyltransferase [Caulobacter sp. S6]